MASVEFCGLIETAAEPVWAVLRQFGRIEDWHPGIARSHIEGAQAGSLPGSVRHLQLLEGGVIRERLLALDDLEMQLSYRFEEAPLPLRDYVATVQVLALSGQPRAVVRWKARFDAETQAAGEHYQTVIRDLIVSGHDSLAAFLGDDRTAA